MQPSLFAAALALSLVSASGSQAAVVSSPIVNMVSPLINGGFESSNVGYGSYRYVDYWATPAVFATGWVFEGASGIANHSSAWGGAATTGSVAFLQNAPGFGAPTLTQTFNINWQSVGISFSLAQRPSNSESLRVLFDGIDLTPTLLTPPDGSWTLYTLAARNVGPGMHTLQFMGINNTDNSDSSLFIDNVRVGALEVPEPGSLALVGIALLGLGVLGRRR